jgi:hypothetical protein
LPAPELITSAPPPPSMMSLPEPVVITLAAVEPVTVNAAVMADASRFSKFATLAESPMVWSAPAATAKLTAVRVAPLATINVSVPEPPSIEVSVPWKTTESLPAPALMTSEPPSPSMVSLPEPPMMVFAPTEPTIVTPEESADASTFWKLETATASPDV